MRIDGQKATDVMASGSPQQPEVELQGLGFGDAMGVKQIMHGLVGGDEGKPVDQFKAFLGEAALLPCAWHAQGGLMHHLQGQARVHV